MDPVMNSVVAKNQACEIENSKIQLHEHANLNNPVVEQASKVLILLVFKCMFYCRISVDIISYGTMFSPYKFNLQRDFSEEDRKFETQRKRSKRLSEWKWSEIINLDDSEDNDKEEELEDTVDSSTNQKTRLKLPRVSIQKRNRFHAV
ncbi:hypothetical protein HanXRQr2_Chr10g0451571 [Helianthus annuus]|uniref:Uncharacterized protein n=1 Tax=Helianthus annuus TaxID=4232 RepID=A0A9K3HZT4_HELAN|nr:hypothetical protein HanXRQr2_Chr10g0451571 [Helianthus annuus]KAJ0514603.1 hypothetical protein HanHA300_Chr10g0371301 [Helianthus annuus]KAJ0522832.1 hypothetical protein HanIR_Chr10g0486931 [Helianthus annuus]